MKKIFKILLPIIALVLLFRMFCGIFVIQPIGMLPEGATIVYFRTELNLPFIASADGILDKSGAGVSLFGRAMLIGKLAQQLKDKEIVRFDYSETFNLWSTNGKTYEK